MPRVGVVIGHFNSFNYLELNLATIRRHCPGVRILVSDDVSNALTYPSAPVAHSTLRPLLEKLVRRFDAEFIVAKGRKGHQLGDWSAIVNGIEWAGRQGIDVLYKLSQRCIVNTVDWANTCAKSMIEKDYDLLTPRIDEAGNSLMTYCLAIRIGLKTQSLSTERLRPRVNMERHVFALAKEFDLQVGLFDARAYSIHHRLVSKVSDFEALAESHGDALQYDLPFHIGP